ncbi:NUMOD4 domain-containing protein, partial [Clostridium perfringens]
MVQLPASATSRSTMGESSRFTEKARFASKKMINYTPLKKYTRKDLLLLDFEEWRPVPGHAPYEASSHGRIRTPDRVITMRNGRTRRQEGKI